MNGRLVFRSCAAIIAVCVAGTASGEVILQCDAGIGAVQEGWTQLMIGTTSNVAGTGIDVTLMTGNPFTVAGRIEGGEGPLADVESDIYFADNQRTSPDSDFVLTLENLTPGVGYKVLSYHNRSNEGDTVIPQVTVTGAQEVISVPESILQNHDIMENPAEIVFVAGSEPVVIRYIGPSEKADDAGCAGCQAFFNGFVLTSGGPTVGFAVESYGGVERLSPALIEVRLENADPNATYTVDYEVSGGTAESAAEPDETIVLTLSNPTGPDILLGTAEHAYTISESGSATERVRRAVRPE